MNVPFVTFQYSDLNVFGVVYLHANRDFQKFITQARKKKSCGFLHIVHLHEIFQNKRNSILDLPYPLTPVRTSDVTFKTELV